jgi:predicted ribosomally synthesized peptide with SipW-like signal peptide
MSKKKLELTRRRVLGGIGTIGIASAAAGLGTSAYLNDTESFEENMMTAGTLDLAVDYVVHEDQGSAGSYTINSFTGEVNGEPSEDVVALDGEGTAMSQTLDDVKPGDHGYSRFCFEIVDNPAYMWACGGLTASIEDGYTEPEPVDNNGEGELEESIEVDVSYCQLDEDGNLVGDEVGETIFSGALNGFLDQLNGGIHLDGEGDPNPAPGDQLPYAGGSDADNPCLCIDWEVPTTVGNEIQGDSLKFDLQFYAEQARHTDGTHNPCLEGENGDGFAKGRSDFSPSVNARGRYGDNNAGTTTGLRELDIRDASDNPEAQGGNEWTSGATESFEVSYDGSEMTLEVNGDSISTSAVSPSDDDAAITVGASGGEVTVENVQVNGQTPSGADSVSADGDTKYLFIAGGGMAAGDSITGDVTFEWSGTPSQEGLKFRVDT